MEFKHLGRAAITLAVGSLLLLPAAARAQSSLATTLDTRMVSAFDAQIIPAPPTTVSSNPLHYRLGRFRIAGIPGATPGHRVRIDVFGNGATMCATELLRTVHARLGLRVTLGPITFVDVIADCPPQVVPTAGILLGAWQPLTSCLPASWAALDTALNNIEVLSAQIVDNGTNNPTMVPGFRSPQAACPTLPTGLPEGKLNAIGGNVQFVQAMDPCSPGIPFGALPNICPKSNVLTDGTPFTLGKAAVRHGYVKWYLKSSAIGAALAGKTVRLLMTFRATDPNSGAQLTYPDQTVLCPPVLVPAAGNVGAGHNLYVDCGLTPTNADENMQSTDMAIIDAGSGLRIAVPGVRQP